MGKNKGPSKSDLTFNDGTFIIWYHDWLVLAKNYRSSNFVIIYKVLPISLWNKYFESDLLLDHFLILAYKLAAKFSWISFS